jgi:Mor family transcriptional regulator
MQQNKRYVAPRQVAEMMGIHSTNVKRTCRRRGVFPVVGAHYRRADIERLIAEKEKEKKTPRPAKIRPTTLLYAGKRGKGSALDPHRDEIIKLYQAGTRVVEIAKKYGVSRAWIYQFISTRIGG